MTVHDKAPLWLRQRGATRCFIMTNEEIRGENLTAFGGTFYLAPDVKSGGVTCVCQISYELPPHFIDLNNTHLRSAGEIKLSILIPVRNEGLNLRIMLKILKAVVEVGYEVLVIYDRADDDSVPVVEELREEQPQLRGIHNTLGAGVINAIRAGVEEARGEYILIFAADEAGPVLAIEEMLKLMEQGCDMVKGAVYAT